MDNYRPFDVTERAKEIVESTGGFALLEDAARDRAGGAGGGTGRKPFSLRTSRVPVGRTFGAGGKVAARRRETIQYGDGEVDLAGVEQLVEHSQTRAIADALQLCAKTYMDGRRTVREVVDALNEDIERDGLDVLNPGMHMVGLARPRRYELAAAINRVRTGKMSE